MQRPLPIANPNNGTIEELKRVPRIGSIETATRCSAIQRLPAGARRELVCKALVVASRALRKWINRFSQRPPATQVAWILGHRPKRQQRTPVISALNVPSRLWRDATHAVCTASINAVLTG